MGIFNFWKKKEERAEEVKIEKEPDDLLLKALLNKEEITRENAMTLPALNSAVDFITNCIAGMPVKLYKCKENKVTEIEKDDRVKFLNGDTGDTLDAFQMKKAMVEDYLLGKGGYCYIRRYKNEITGLFYVEEKYISVINGTNHVNKIYQIYVDGAAYKDYEFIKILRNTKDGGQGVGLIKQVSTALETAYQTLLYQLGMVATGGNKKGFLKSVRKLGQDEINILKKAWARLYSNKNTKTENVIVLNNGLEFQEASATAVETQLNESKKTLQEEINAIFHIYPNDFDRTFKEAIYPIIKAFETALNKNLLLEKEKKNFYFEFDVKELIRVSVKERYEAYRIAKDTGFMTLNEIRKAENMEFVEGLDVINVGLGAVLYDINKHIYYTPNTNTVGNVETVENQQETTETGMEENEEENQEIERG